MLKRHLNLPGNTQRLAVILYTETVTPKIYLSPLVRKMFFFAVVSNHVPFLRCKFK
jgi:hypothetical protein